MTAGLSIRHPDWLELDVTNGPAKNPGRYCGLGGTGVACPIGIAAAPAPAPGP